MSDGDRQVPEPEYEPPRAQDVETDDAPSVTAAGKTAGGLGAN
jgi:hypothetical protein